MYLAGHAVVSVLAFTVPLLLSYVGFFSPPSNRKQHWRFLSKLSDESSSIRWYYNSYTISVLHGLAEIINEVQVMKLPRSSEARRLVAWTV